MSDTNESYKVVYGSIILILICLFMTMFIYIGRNVHPVTEKMSDEEALEFMLSLNDERLYKYMDSINKNEYERLLKLHLGYIVTTESINDSFNIMHPEN